MTLIKSISGIRGTIGGEKGHNLTPIDIVECTAAYASLIKSKTEKRTIVVGRDGRITGPMVNGLVVNTLRMSGFNVIDLGLTTTPTVEIAVPKENAGGGIILTASHNPKQWNALKFLNEDGEFISGEDGEALLNIIHENSFTFSEVDDIGTYQLKDDYFQIHVNQIQSLDYLNFDLVKSKKYKVVVDCINSTGALAIPVLLDALGVSYVLINDEITGDFAHNPEPLPKHLSDLMSAVKLHKADMGISVDPDVDRLAFVMENGECLGEEYTLVTVADFILRKKKGNTVSNLSSTRALSDITRKHGGEYFAAAVGEVNVVNQMKAHDAVIGGEGNGGVILPDLHYGRDALVGIACVLNLMAETNMSLTQLRQSYADYYIVKNKIDLSSGIDLQEAMKKVSLQFSKEKQNRIDGLKIDFEDGWVHLRKSNTEPIIRVYAESNSIEKANQLANEVMSVIS